QIADERADGRPSPTPRRKGVPRRIAPAHLERALARELEHVPVEQEESRQAELVDQLQLFVEPLACPVSEHLVICRIALLERAPTDLRELDDRRLGAVGEVRVPIAELLREVELQPFGEFD